MKNESFPFNFNDPRYSRYRYEQQQSSYFSKFKNMLSSFASSIFSNKGEENGINENEDENNRQFYSYTYDYDAIQSSMNDFPSLLIYRNYKPEVPPREKEQKEEKERGIP